VVVGEEADVSDNFARLRSCSRIRSRLSLAILVSTRCLCWITCRPGPDCSLSSGMGESDRPVKGRHGLDISEKWMGQRGARYADMAAGILHGSHKRKGGGGRLCQGTVLVIV
jgi:hypothetical protein